MERKLNCVARYSLITSKFKVPSSARGLQLWCLLHMTKCIVLKWWLYLAIMCTQMERAPVHIRQSLIVFQRVRVNKHSHCCHMCSYDCVSHPEVWLQLNYGMWPGRIGRDKVSQTEGASEEPGVVSTVPDSRLGWDFSHILAMLAMTLFCLKQFGVILVTMEIYCVLPARLPEMYLLRWQSQSSQSVFTLWLTFFLIWLAKYKFADLVILTVLNVNITTGGWIQIWLHWNRLMELKRQLRWH